MDPSDIVQIIRSAATANGVDPDLLVKFGQAESGLDPNAAASGSSAQGLFQFTGPTWKEYGQGDPTDPVANADAAARLMKDNAAKLSAAGLDTSPGSLYLAHFAGEGGAQKLLTADPSASVASILGDAAVKANPFLAKMAVSDVLNWASRKMGSSAPAAPVQTASAQPAPQGILSQPTAQQPTASAAPGILNNAPQEDLGASFQNTLAQLMARQQAQQAPVPQLPPIQFAVPKGIQRARLLAALSRPIGV